MQLSMTVLAFWSFMFCQITSYVIPLPSQDVIIVSNHAAGSIEEVMKQDISQRAAQVASGISEYAFSELEGDWAPPKEQYFDFALGGAEEMAVVALARLINGGATHPSFQRYFNPGDYVTVRRMLTRVLAYTGTPEVLDTLDECDKDVIQATKMIAVDDHDEDWGHQLCHNGDVQAYLNNEHFRPDGKQQAYMVLCPLFWSQRILRPLPILPNVPAVQNLGASIDDGLLGVGRTGPTESSSTTLLHELLHLPEISKPVLEHLTRPPDTVDADDYQIDDLVIINPENSHEIKAYRAYYAMKVKDPAWRAPEGPVFNVDNYVSLVQELFYQEGDRQWEDPPAAQFDG